MIVDAQGKPLGEAAKQLSETIQVDLKAFAEWQASRNEGKGILMQSLDAIARSSVLSIVKTLPPNQLQDYLSFFFAALENEIQQFLVAKKAETAIRQSLQAANDQQQPS